MLLSKLDTTLEKTPEQCSISVIFSVNLILRCFLTGTEGYLLETEILVLECCFSIKYAFVF